MKQTFYWLKNLVLNLNKINLKFYKLSFINIPIIILNLNNIIKDFKYIKNKTKILKLNKESY